MRRAFPRGREASRRETTTTEDERHGRDVAERPPAQNHVHRREGQDQRRDQLKRLTDHAAQPRRATWREQTADEGDWQPRCRNGRRRHQHHDSIVEQDRVVYAAPRRRGLAERIGEVHENGNQSPRRLRPVVAIECPMAAKCASSPPKYTGAFDRSNR